MIVSSPYTSLEVLTEEALTEESLVTNSVDDSLCVEYDRPGYAVLRYCDVENPYQRWIY